MNDKESDRGQKVVISLGSNVDKERNLPEAIRLLSKMCSASAVSSIYETSPVGSREPLNFWNAAVLIETELDPRELRLTILDPIERMLKRVRTEDKNAPRTIDLDLILYGDKILDIDEDHHIPDPDLLRHIHLAKPVTELMPDELHPETGKSYREILHALEQADSADVHKIVTKVSKIETKKLLQ